MNLLVGESHVLKFGKHKGKTLGWCLQNEPSYIVWIADNKIQGLAVKPELLTKAREAAESEKKSYHKDFSSYGLDNRREKRRY